MSQKLTVIALATTMTLSAAAQAEEIDKPMFSFGGFGTVGIVHSSEKNADFQNSVFQPNGVGRTYNWDMNIDSKLAVQMTANFTPQLSAVVQVISEQRYDNSYIPMVEWANLKYAFTPDFNVRVGRTVLPAYLLSDSRKVGYATPWVRPPVSLYSLVPITNSDGIDASYRFRAGPVTNTVQASFGRNEILVAQGENGQARRVWGVYDTLEYGAATFHVAYQRLNLTLPQLNALFDNYRMFGPVGSAIADKYNSDHKQVTFVGAGVSYDPGDWFLMAEAGRQTADSFIGDQTAWYVSGGYRFGSFTPYATYSHLKTTSNTSDPGIDPVAAAAAAVAALPPGTPGPVIAQVAGGVAGAAVGLSGLLNSLLMATDEHTVSLGVRWDFAKNADLKVQFDRMYLGNNAMGTLRNLDPVNFRPGGNVNLFSVAVDFVF